MCNTSLLNQCLDFLCDSPAMLRLYVWLLTLLQLLILHNSHTHQTPETLSTTAATYQVKPKSNLSQPSTMSKRDIPTLIAMNGTLTGAQKVSSSFLPISHGPAWCVVTVTTKWRRPNALIVSMYAALVPSLTALVRTSLGDLLLGIVMVSSIGSLPRLLEGTFSGVFIGY